jgi:hypothetical protein
MFMRIVLAACAATWLSAVGVDAQVAPQPAAPATPAAPAFQIDKACPAGAAIQMDLAAGQYVVRASPDARLRLRWATRDPGDASKVYAKADVAGNDARVSISGPSNGFSATIEVPARSNVTVTLTAGDFSIDPLDGDVDISAWAGKMQVGVGDPAAYYSVYASVTAGQIRADRFGGEKGGLLRSVSWEGKGKHALRVRLTAGEVILQAPSSK